MKSRNSFTSFLFRKFPDIYGEKVCDVAWNSIAGLLIRNSRHQEGGKNYGNTGIMVGGLLAAAIVAVLWARIEAMVTMEGGQRRKWLM